jgi:dihydroorotase
MLKIINALDIFGKPVDLNFVSEKNHQLEANGLTVFPGLIDPHVHFRTPGLEHKEDWISASKAALSGGYTTVFDMPNTLPPTITSELLRSKKALIDAQLKQAHILLHYHLFFGADKNHLDQIQQVSKEIIGIKVFMGCSTGNLVIDDDESLHAVFKIASELNLIVAVHAEDESLLKERKKHILSKDYADHSLIRNIDVAVKAVEKAIALSRQYNTQLYILHVSSKDEIDLIKQAKKEKLSVFAETTPHHLFLNSSYYSSLQGKAVVNPPLREELHQQAIFDAIYDGTIDTIGSDHAPHTISEKSLPYGQCPSGMPGIETTLPLLLNAYHQGKISLEKIISLTYHQPKKIFNLKETNDIVLIDLNKSQTINQTQLKTKCHWSAFNGATLKGWPKYVILNNRLYDLSLL